MARPSDKWIPLSKYYPDMFALVEIEHSDGRIQNGWWTGHSWDGRRKIDGSTIVYWRPLEAFSRKEINEY